MLMDRPIVVTGCPRSGTTWMGNVIGESREVFRIYEPFNDDVGAKLDLPERFMRVTQGSSDQVKDEIDDLIKLGGFKHRALLAIRGTAERCLPASWRYTPARLAARRLLRERKDFVSPRRVCIKDPIAFFSAEWLAETYDAQVIVLVRHPCGVAGSYLSLDWDSDLPGAIRHPVTGRHSYLNADVERRNSEPPDRLRDLILQWKLFTAHTLELKARHPDWLFVLHDELCIDPAVYFERIFTELGLSLTPAIENKIRQESTGSDPQGGHQHSHVRDSRAVVDAWKKKIPEGVASRVLSETALLWDEAQGSLSWSDESDKGVKTRNAAAFAEVVKERQL